MKPARPRQLQDCGTGFVLGQAQGLVYQDGFSDHTAQLWSESGAPLATRSQIGYFKEQPYDEQDGGFLL